MDRTRRSRRGGLLALLVGGIFAVGAPVSADDGVARGGLCNRAAHWDLSIDREGGRLDFELDIETYRSGRVWQVDIKQNGVLFYSAHRTTDHEGDIEVERLRPNRDGTDTFRFRAIQQSNGQVCRGSKSI